jgi:hypothetical protein
MDQAASSNIALLWYKRERCENPNLDRRIGVCAGGHREKEDEAGPSEPLLNFADFECHPFSKNIVIRGGYHFSIRYLQGV